MKPKLQLWKGAYLEIDLIEVFVAKSQQRRFHMCQLVWSIVEQSVEGVSLALMQQVKKLV